MQQLLIRRSTRRVFLLLAAALLLGSSSALLTSAAEDAPPLVLEPGEVVTDRADRSSLIPLEEGPSTKKAATCDSAESRRARAIIREVFLPRLPSSYPLPLTCPFHPNLDLLQLEDASKRKLSRTQWKCLTCGRVFASQQHVDEHIQHRHMQHAGANAVCLADFCDVLACKHRSVRYDPITGEQLLSGVTEGGLYGSAASRAAAKRKLSDVGGKGSKRAAEDRLAIPGALSAEEQKRRGSQPLEHPHADRCNAATMEVARMKCQAIMLQCFSNDEAAAAGGLSSAAVHALYEQFRADICDGLRCTPDGEYANAGLLAAQRSAESRSRLSTIGGFLLLFVLATFYCLVYSMRHEFGWTRAMPWGGAGGGRARSSLLAQAKEKSLLEKAQQWIGLQQKKRNTPSKLI